MLEVKDLNVSYGASQALYDIDLRADRGEISCVLGRNGVGKTSLVRAVAGRHIATSGQIFWNGDDICKKRPGFPSKTWSRIRTPGPRNICTINCPRES